jgi:segregation and condensation protein B
MTDEQVTDLVAFYEALLFIAERPLSLGELADQASVPPAQAEAGLQRLGSDLESGGRGLRLQRMGDEFQLVTAPEVGERLAEYAARDAARVTPAALEALAIVAYRQPCTRSEVDRVRGVDSDYVLRSLLHRRLIAEVGRRDTPGRPILYATTFTFLERFGLTSLDELPVLSSHAAGMVAAAASPDGEAIAIPDAG